MTVHCHHQKSIDLNVTTNNDILKSDYHLLQSLKKGEENVDSPNKGLKSLCYMASAAVSGAGAGAYLRLDTHHYKMEDM